VYTCGLWAFLWASLKSCLFMSVSYRRLNGLWFSTRLRGVILCTFCLFLQFLVQLHKKTRQKTSYELWQWNEIKSKHQSSPCDFIFWRPHPVFCKGIPQGSILGPIMLWTMYLCNYVVNYYCIMGSHACKKSNINVTGIVHSKIKILHVIPNSCITSSANKKLYNIVSFSARKIFYLTLMLH